MLKKSFIVVIIQIIGLILSLLSIYFIAGDMAPEVYSLVGVYTVIANIYVTFSDLGLETTMMREALYWIEKGDNDKVSEYISQAILARFVGFIVLTPFIVIYVIVLSQSKYDGKHLIILISFIIGAVISALNDGFAIVIRSQGGYVFSQLTRTINSYVLKFGGIALYFEFGATVYLMFYSFSSIPVLIVFIIKLKRFIRFKNIRLKPTLRKIIEAKYLWLRTDLDYFRNNADGLLVSALFPATIMGSYTIFKTLEQMSKTFIEGFFDVLSQNSVKYKGNYSALVLTEQKFKKARNIFIFIILGGTGVFMINPQFFISLIHLNKYENLEYLIICIAIVSIVHLIGKYEINAIAFLGTSKHNFKIGLFNFCASVLSFLVVIVLKNFFGIMIQRVFIYLFNSMVCIYIFVHEKKQMYTNINK